MYIYTSQKSAPQQSHTVYLAIQYISRLYSKLSKKVGFEYVHLVVL